MEEAPYNETNTFEHDISIALKEKPVPNSNFFQPTDDNFCSGLVTKVFVVMRRLYSIPFEVCLVGHSGLVCETTRKRAYMLEFCEDFPVFTHDVTDTWSFKPATRWTYGGYTYSREYHGVAVPVVSYNVQYVAKLFQCSADKRGEYILSGNNCHVVQEHIRLTLGLAAQAELHYGTYVKPLELDFDPLKEMKPFYYM